MKKFLLIKPAYNFFPIGLAHVMTSLDKRQIVYDFVDLLRCDTDWKNDLKNGCYYAVGTGGLTGDMMDIKGIRNALDESGQQIPLILGGKIVSDMPGDILYDKTGFDYAIDGEGELVLPALLESIRKNRKMTEIPDGLLFYSNIEKRLIRGPKMKPISMASEDLYPTWDRVDVAHYLDAGIGGFPGFRAFPVLTGRGCTGRCTFCSPTNGSFRMRRIDHVMAELFRLNRTYEFEGFAFANEIFYPTSKLIRQFLDAYRQSGINKPWVCLLRVDIDESILTEMKDSGCIGISYGVESGSDRILKQLRKNTTVQSIVDFTRTMKRVGIPAFGSFMLGNDNETEGELNQTIDLLINEDIAGPSALLLAYPGTEIYGKALESGKIPDERGYIDGLSFSNILHEGTYRNNPYMNVSAIPEHRFFGAVLDAFRRYSTHRFLKNQAVSINLDKLTGKCPVCGEVLDIPFRIDTLLGMERFCPKCFHAVFFNFYPMERFAGHFDTLRKRIVHSDRIAIVGTGINAKFLHLYDVFSLKLSKLTWVVCEESSHARGYFFNTPVCTVQDLNPDDVDLIILCDTWNAVNITEVFVKKGFSPNSVCHIMPSDWLTFIRDLYRETSHERMNRLFELGLAQATPQPGTEGFRTLMTDIGITIKRHLEDSPQKNLYLMPAGGFGVKAAEILEATGIRISGFIDNYKWKTEKTINGKTVFSPVAVKSDIHDLLLIATPSYQAQKSMKDQICGSHSFSDDAVLLIGDLVIHREMERNR